jgi:hypothetical protein
MSSPHPLLTPNLPPPRTIFSSCAAAQQTDIFDFLVGVLQPGMKPQYAIDAENAMLEEEGGAGGAGAGAAGAGGRSGRGTRRGSGRSSGRTGSGTRSHHGMLAGAANAGPYGLVPFATGPRTLGSGGGAGGGHG